MCRHLGMCRCVSVGRCVCLEKGSGFNLVCVR